MGMVTLRLILHRHPELSFDERRTAEIIAERLHAAKLEVRATGRPHGRRRRTPG